MKKEFRKTAVFLTGLAVEAFGIAVFILPFNLVIGGPSGIGRMLYLYFGIPVSLGVGIINAALFLLGLFSLGRRFASTIVVGTFALPFFLDVFGRMEILQGLTDDPLLGTVLGGLMIGAGMGLVIRNGGSTGGSDVLPIVLNRKLGLPLAPMLYGVELVVMIWQAFEADSEEILLGLLMTLIYIVVMNQILVMGKGLVQIMIFSPDANLINAELMKLGVGATLFHGRTGFLGEERDTIICVVSRRYINGVKDAVLHIDPATFMTISSVREVNGRGFTIDVPK